MSAPVNMLRVCEQSDSPCLLQLRVQSWQCQCLSDLILCEVTVNQILKKWKILNLSGLSPNVNSLDIDKHSCSKLDQKTCVILRNYGFTSLAFPTWYMYSVNPFGNSTLSCDARSIALSPECPWIARRYRNWLEEFGFTQYWNLFDDVTVVDCSVASSKNWLIMS